jgi:hypothetical protein
MFRGIPAIIGPAISIINRLLGPVRTIIGLMGRIPGVSAILRFAGPIANIMLLIDTVKLLAKVWSENWGNIQERVQAVMDKVGPALEKMGDSFDKLIKGKIDPKQFLGDIGKGIGDILGAFGKEGGQFMWDFFNKIKEEFPGLAPIIDTFRNAWDGVSSVFKVLQPGLSAIGEGIGKTVEKLGPFGEQLMSTFDAIRPVIELFGVIVGAAFAIVFNVLGHLIEVLLPTLIDIWTSAFKTIEGVIRLFTTIIEGIVNIIVDIFTGNWTKLRDDSIKLFEDIVNSIKLIFEGMWGVISGAVTGVISSIVAVFEGLIETVTGDQEQSVLSRFRDGISNFFKNLPSNVLNFVTDAAKGIAKGFWDAMTVNVQIPPENVPKPRGHTTDPEEVTVNMPKRALGGPIYQTGPHLMHAGEYVLTSGINEMLSAALPDIVQTMRVMKRVPAFMAGVAEQSISATRDMINSQSNSSVIQYTAPNLYIQSFNGTEEDYNNLMTMWRQASSSTKRIFVDAITEAQKKQNRRGISI